jgi:uncharacterized protein YprB with RNaseH-like and TPR domain
VVAHTSPASSVAPASPGATAEATRDRLRRLIHDIETSGPRARTLVAPQALSIDEVMPELELRELASGRVWVGEQCTPFAQHIGEQPLDHLRYAEGDALTVLARDDEVGDAALEDLLFLDIETTGLGGTGAMAFLVAIARVEVDAAGDRRLRLTQYLAPSPPDEAALLEALLADIDPAGADPVLVTYNGRTFDAPFLDGRTTMHRMRGGFDALRHVDLLHASRTVYRGTLLDCRLATVEADVMRLTRHEDEVAGAQVPAWYFRFLRSGDAHVLRPLIEHNAVDVISLAALTGRLAAMLRGAVEARGAEALGIGRLLARVRRYEPAQRQFERALDGLPAGHARAETSLRLAQIHKRARRRHLAEPLWLEVAAAGRVGALAAWTELAKYYEHERQEFERALSAVDAALAHVESSIAPYDQIAADRHRDGLLHRRKRVHFRAEREP